MFRMMNGMGPRGLMNGHRGPGGAAALAVLAALILGGWMIAAVIGTLLYAAVLVIGGIFSGLSSVVSDVFSGMTSSTGLAVGIVIGVILYSLLKRRNNAGKAEENAEETHQA